MIYSRNWAAKYLFKYFSLLNNRLVTGTSIMKIELLLFAHLKEIVGTSQLFLDFDRVCTGNDVLEKMEKLYPAIAPLKKHLKISVNGEYAKLTDAIPQNSEVALIPPVSGG